MSYFTQTSTPSSEVTGLFCRIPWPEFSRAPWIIHPTHLRWFPVRFACAMLRSFSRQLRLNGFRPCGLGLASRLYCTADLPAVQAYLLPPGLPTPGPSTFLRPFIARAHKHVNINTFPISYAFQPCLRGRLTLGRLPLPRKPWVYGERVSRPFYRYSCQHNHFSTVQETLRAPFCL